MPKRDSDQALLKGPGVIVSQSQPLDETGLPGDWLNGGIAVLDEVGRVIDVNEPLRHWLALRTRPEAVMSNFWAALATLQPGWGVALEELRSRSERFCQCELLDQNGVNQPAVRLQIARHGGVCFLHLDSVVPPLEELEEGASEELLKNPTAQRQMFVRLLRAEGQLNNLVRRWPGVIFSQRVDLSFHFVSPKIEELTGVPVHEWQRLPQRFWQVVHEGDTDELRQQLRRTGQSGQGVTSIYRIRHIKTGRVAYVLEHREAVRTELGLLLGYEGVWLDVTRQTIAEKRLSTAAWKETLAVLTMGLVHDFSNIMAGIHSLSEAFEAQVGPEHPFHEGLALIKRNSMQATQLIHRILHLHQGKIGERNYYNLNELVTEILELVRKVVPRHVRIETVLAPESLPVYADPVEFRQVLINLALNSVDAMPQGGRLRFQVSSHDTYPALMQVQGALPRLPAACVTVQDEGCGIPARHLASVFDPFFTTKSLDKGSGLGLYNARLFAEKHHGAISIDSEEKKGTIARVWLPQADFTEAEQSERPLRTQRRTLLLFGQAGGILDSMAEFLRQNGYSIIVTPSLDRALEAFQDPDYSLAGILLMTSSGDASYGRLATAAHRHSPTCRVIVQIAGCNQDELDSELLAGADLVLPTDLSRSETLSRIVSLFP